MAERVRRFEAAEQNAGAVGIDTSPLPSQGYLPLMLEPAATACSPPATRRAPYTLLLGENDQTRRTTGSRRKRRRAA